MRFPKRAIVAVAVAIVAASSLAACVPIPPGEPSNLRCWSGEHTTSTGIGTLKFRSKVCWDNAVIVSAGRDGSTCTNPNGSSAGIPDVGVEGRGVGGFNPTYTTTMRARCTFAGGSVYENHRHTVTPASHVHKYCYTPYCSDSAAALPEVNEPAPPPPAPAPRWVQGTRVTTDGSALPYSTVTVDGTTVSNGTNGSFEYTLPNDFPSQHTVTVSVPPGYSVAWTACSNKTSCHDDRTPTPGNSVTANPDPGTFLDVRWYFTRTGTIQGFKMVDHIGESAYLPAVQALWVEVDGQRVSDGPVNPYVVENLTAGNHFVQVEAPAGWYVGYTLCYNNIYCHNDPVHEWTDRVNVNVPAGGYADLYWHYFQL